MSGSEAFMPLASKGSLKIYGLGLNKLCKSNTLRKKEKTRTVFVRTMRGVRLHSRVLFLQSQLSHPYAPRSCTISLCPLQRFRTGVSPPHDEALLFRQKCPKPFPPVRGPYGVPPPTPRIRWRGNSLRSNSPRQEVDSGLRLRRIRRRGCPQNERPQKRSPSFSGLSDCS